MNCSQFELWIVSDDAEDRRLAAEHAADCSICGPKLAGHSRVARQVEAWRVQDSPPKELEERIRLSLVRRAEADIVPISQEDTAQPEPPKRSLLWWALAASFFIGIGLGVLQYPWGPEAPIGTKRLLAAADLDLAAASESEQRGTIDRLERQAAPILARATDTQLASHRAARLLEYRNRLASLDVAIEDVEGFVAMNPGHPRARSLLMDAYLEKQEVLREVVALEEKS